MAQTNAKIVKNKKAMAKTKQDIPKVEDPKPEPELEPKPETVSSDDDTEPDSEPEPEAKPESKSETVSSDDDTEPDAEPTPSPAPVVKKTRAKKTDGTKKPRKVHKDKASEYDEGYTKTEDGIDYIVKNKRWVVVKPEKKAVQKKPPTAYGLFIGTKMKEIRAEQPGLPSSEYMKLAMVAWKALTVEEKVALKEAMTVTTA